MTNAEAIKILNEIIDEGWLISDFDKCIAIDACEMAIKALSEPTIPLSVVEKITAEIEERATYEGIHLDRADVLAIIDKVVKEYIHEEKDNS